MLIIGLTGGIATGKSTVSSILSSAPYSLPIIDADKIARQVVEPGTVAYKAIIAHFLLTTPDLLLPSQDPSIPSTSIEHRPINRPVLGRRVFGPGRTHDRKVLDSIIHPAVRREIFKNLFHYYIRGHGAVVLDIPLLYEAGMDMICGMVVVVGVKSISVQTERLRLRDPHLSVTEARDRVESQWDVRDKARRCQARGPNRGKVIWNDGTREDLEIEVRKLMGDVYRQNPAWWKWILLFSPWLLVLIAMRESLLNWRTRRSWNRQNKIKAKL